MALLPIKKTITYIQQYGGRCRDCADEQGICPNSGLPCKEREKAIEYVIKAINYGTAHGYLKANQ